MLAVFYKIFSVRKIGVKAVNRTMTSHGAEDAQSEPWNFSWIVPGLLAGSSYPHTMDNLVFFKKQGISRLITLSPEYQPPVTNFPGLQWSFIPIEEFEAPTLENVKQFIELCEIEKEHKQAIAIHCRAGRGRTGLMAAIYLVHFFDMSPESAITKLRLMRPGSVETYQQEKAVWEYWDYLRTKTK